MAKRKGKAEAEDRPAPSRGRPTPYLDEYGREVLDDLPMAPPVGYRKQESMIEIVRNMVRSENLRLAALEADQESFAEADDFEIGDDYDPHSPYENEYEPPVQELIRRRQEEGLPSYKTQTELAAKDVPPVAVASPGETKGEAASPPASPKKEPPF